jgi:hypothetical protein
MVFQFECLQAFDFAGKKFSISAAIPLDLSIDDSSPGKCFLEKPPTRPYD